MNETYYDLLGVPSDASREAIELAYRERLKQTHPDISDDEDAADRTRRLIEARDVLTDEDERNRYDRLGHERYVEVEVKETEVGATDRDGGVGGAASASPGERRDDRTSTGTGSEASSAAGTASTSGFDPGEGNAEAAAAGQEGHSGHVGRPGWSSQNGVDGRRESRTGESEFATRRSKAGLHHSRLFPLGPSLALLFATFLTYPVLLWGALFPPFPLVLRIAIGACGLLVVAYLQSLPEVGVAVFGAWSVLVPAVFLALGAPLVSLVGAVAVLGTVLPLGLSALTRAVMR